jgi:RNA polymerase sigma-70 factor (ECF subfamily)
VDQVERARFEVVYRANVRPLLAYALTRTSRDNAQDVVASTFLVAWRRIDQVPVDALPWLIGVARRVLADQWRSESRRTALGHRLAADAVTGSTSFRDVADSLVLRNSIRHALMRLRPKDREIVMLVAWQSLSTQQLAVALGCSKALASLRLHKARTRFAELFDAQLEDSLSPDGATLRPVKEAP